MSGYEVTFYPDALKDVKRLDGSQRKNVLKAIEKIRANPLPQNEGGFGKPLGNKAGTDLTGLMKIKLRGSGIRIVYRLIKIKGKMAIVVVGGSRAQTWCKSVLRSVAANPDVTPS